MVIYIKKSPSADSRTADPNKHISFEEFSKSTDMHREDVLNTMNELARLIQEAGKNHDWTKKEKEKEFYEQFTASKEKGFNFKESKWYKYHATTERHHLNSNVPKDVNLIDVLEMIADCCCAGMARSGNVYDLELPDEVLQNAFQNTVDMVKKMIKIDNNNENDSIKNE